MTYIDGLQCGIYGRDEIQELVKADVSAITITAAIWEDALETMDALAKWNELALDNSDLMLLARSVGDIAEAERTGRVAIILGAQNSSPLNDRLGFVEHFANLGLRVMQLTYNNQNAIGASCYEQQDGGLSRFGREVVSEMNRVGMLVDLSHVGDRTSLEAIRHSEKPVAITHANPASLHPHPRNRSDDVIKELAAREGVLGLAPYNNISGEFGTSAEKWCELILRTVDLIGTDHVAIGSDFGPNIGVQGLDWMRRGRWTRSEQSGAALPGQPPAPKAWFDNVDQFREVELALQTIGQLSDAETGKILHGNWLRLYGEVFPCSETELSGKAGSGGEFPRLTQDP